MTIDTQLDGVEQREFASVIGSGLFTPAEGIMDAFEQRYIKGRRFPNVFTWIGSPVPPPPSGEPDTATVLSLNFGSLEETFDRGWEWVQELFPRSERWGNLFSDADHLQQVYGMEFRPWSRTWQTIRLSARVGARPCEALNANLPGVGTLFAAAQHPERIRRIDGRTYPGLWLSGLHCRSPNERKVQTRPPSHLFPRTPLLTFNPGRNILELTASWNSDEEPGLSVPMLVNVG